MEITTKQALISTFISMVIMACVYYLALEVVQGEADLVAGEALVPRNLLPVKEPMQHSSTSTEQATIINKEVLLDLPIINQKPELSSGCEVVSLAMITQYLGLPYSKLELAEMLPRDPTPMVKDASGNVVTWGDPKIGYVGDITGRERGYSIYHQPMEQFFNRIYPNGVVNLTGTDFTRVRQALSRGKPVLAWTTINFKPTDQWFEWKTPDGQTIQGTRKIHAVVIVGYDANHVYVNNPFIGKKAQPVALDDFLASWEQMGKQAITIK
jgi:uncharacterized protein YvpB